MNPSENTVWKSLKHVYWSFEIVSSKANAYGNGPDNARSFETNSTSEASEIFNPDEPASKCFQLSSLKMVIIAFIKT